MEEIGARCSGSCRSFASSRHYSRWTVIAIAGLSLIILAGSKVSLAQAEREPAILTVLIFNYSGASAAELERATMKSNQIFDRSGIQLAWKDCPVLPTPAAPSACRNEPAPGEIRVRILARRLSNSFQDSVFGFAIAPVWASVYYESARRLTQITSNSESDTSVILGCLIAHEIGHLLLGNAHTANGIMRARWEIRQIQQAMMGALVFAPEQFKVMQANAQMRAKPLGSVLATQLPKVPPRE